MKIIFIIPSLRNGGAERVVANLSNFLNDDNHEVIIITFQEESYYSVNSKLITIHSGSSSNLLKKISNIYYRIIHLKNILKSEKADLILSFTETCNIPAILTGEKINISIRNHPRVKLSFLQKLSVFILYRLPNVMNIVSVSAEIQQYLQNKYYLKKIITISNPINLMLNLSTDGFEFQNHFKKNLYWLAVGRLDKQKGFDLLIKAYAQSIDIQKMPLVIIGIGNEYNYLMNIISNYNLEDKVFLLGKKENITSWYKNCFAFVLSSRFEGFPNVLIEALYNECPVIAANCPSGPKEIITDTNGLLVEANSSDALMKAMLLLVKSKKIRTKIQKNAKQSVLHLDIKNIAQKWLSLK